MQGHQDNSSFIKSFTGSHHFVLDYLLEEVLQQQPENVQIFLLRKYILERLCGPLCDAVLFDLPSASGHKTLEYIEHANLSSSPWITSSVGTVITICLGIYCAIATAAGEPRRMLRAPERETGNGVAKYPHPRQSVV